MFCRTARKEEKKMEIPTYIYGIFPSKKREEIISKRNVRVIKEFLCKREKLEIAKEDELAHLKQLRKKRSINRAIYNRLKRVMILTHEQKRIDLIEATIKKSIRMGKSVVSFDSQPTEDNQQLEPNSENN
jgi:hypothetical protein